MIEAYLQRATGLKAILRILMVKDLRSEGQRLMSWVWNVGFRLRIQGLRFEVFRDKVVKCSGF